MTRCPDLLYRGLYLAGTLLVDGVRFLYLCLRPAVVLAAANLFLRQQLAFYQERHSKPRRATNAARFTLATWGVLTWPWDRVFPRHRHPCLYRNKSTGIDSQRPCV
jgi:hypothetical protein